MKCKEGELFAFFTAYLKHNIYFQKLIVNNTFKLKTFKKIQTQGLLFILKKTLASIACEIIQLEILTT